MKQKLTLYPDTFLWMKGNRILLYNAKFYTFADFTVTDVLCALCGQLCDYDNLYSILVDTETSDAGIRNFLSTVVTRNLGMLSELDSLAISLPPLLNIQNDILRLKQGRGRDIGENILTYLSTLTIYIGGSCRSKSYYRQIIYPVCSKEKLDAATIENFLKTIASPYLHVVNLVVSDAADSEIAFMAELLSAYKEQITFYFLYSEFKDGIVIAHMLTSAGYKVRFIGDSAILDSSQSREMILSIAGGLDMKRLLSYDFLVKSEKDCRFWRDVIQETGVTDYQWVPVYDNNAAYFKENVFLNESEIQESRLSRREVFAHQAINTVSFGSLTVMPDRRIYSDVDSPALGTIRDSIYEIILREMESNYSWRKIRNTKKCCDCIYQWLCPSPTPYEKVMNVECVCNTVI